jgi:hypothetical protein
MAEFRVYGGLWRLERGKNEGSKREYFSVKRF